MAVNAPSPSVEAAKALEASAEWAHQRFMIHFAACRTRHTDVWCQMCDDLDLDANRLESQARAAAGEGR